MAMDLINLQSFFCRTGRQHHVSKIRKHALNQFLQLGFILHNQNGFAMVIILKDLLSHALE